MGIGTDQTFLTHVNNKEVTVLKTLSSSTVFRRTNVLSLHREGSRQISLLIIK